MNLWFAELREDRNARPAAVEAWFGDIDTGFRQLREDMNRGFRQLTWLMTIWSSFLAILMVLFKFVL